MARMVFKLSNGEEHSLSRYPAHLRGDREAEIDDKEGEMREPSARPPFEDVEHARRHFARYGLPAVRYLVCDDGVIIFHAHIQSVRFEA